MDRLDNPYRPGAGTRPPALLGRDQLIDGFGVALRRAMTDRPGKSYMPVGLRGVGKTVLLNRFAEIAEQEGVTVAFMEAPETEGFARLLAVRLRTILLSMSTGQARAAVNKALAVLRSFTMTLPDGASIQLGIDPLAGHGDSGLLSEDLTDVLVATGEAAAKHDTGLLLAVDEVQYLARDELGALITAIHRTTQLNLPVVLVGAGLPQLPGLAGEAKSYAERLFEFPTIGALPTEDAKAVLAVPADELGVEYTDDALDLILAESRGYPYFLQEWGHHVWNAAPGPTVTAADVEAVRTEVTATLDENFFHVRMERLTPAEKHYLRAMANLGPGPHRSGDIAAELAVKVESVAPRRSALIRKGMIYSPAHGDTAFTVPLFDDFLRRNAE
ncbi:MAG: ATP-binding protein [Acidimicrobiales bacterium]